MPVLNPFSVIRNLRQSDHPRNSDGVAITAVRGVQYDHSGGVMLRLTSDYFQLDNIIYRVSVLDNVLCIVQ